MFCCTRKQTHNGQIVTALCLEPQCTKNRNQLSCIACAQEDHQGHNLTSLRKMLPELLEAEREKELYKAHLQHLLEFVCRQFGEEDEEGAVSNVSNIVQRSQELLSSLKQQVQLNNEEMSKMKSIFKNLNKNNQQSLIKASPSKNEEELLPADSPLKSANISAILMKTNQSITSKSKMISNQIPVSQSIFSPDIDCFSHSAKHPYLSISSDSHTASKVSHSGHRFAAIGAKSFSDKEFQLRVRIDRSVSGNIMIGLCHESVVRDKEFCNSYGIGNGTYLIGQNGNNPSTAISFHHSIAVMNRKEVVGWNFQEGDIVLIGLNFTDHYIYFRRQARKPSQEFTMKTSGPEIKSELKGLIAEGFKFIVLLQSQGDQVSIVEE